VQINIGHVDANGTFNNDTTTFALSGYIRFKGRGDNSLNKLAAQAGLMKAMDSFPHPEAKGDDEDDE
jgi:small subunit ribosomal protein S21e